MFRRLERRTNDVTGRRLPRDAIEKDRFANASEADQKNALRMTLGLDAIQTDGDAFQNGIATRQFRRGTSRAGRIWVFPRVHKL